MNAYIFRDKYILVTACGHEVPSHAQIIESFPDEILHDKFIDKSTGCIIARLPDGHETVPQKFEWIAVREYFFLNEKDTSGKAAVVAHAKGILEWTRATVFCSRCGTRLEIDATVNAKNCPVCKAQYFPRIEPCVIILVSRGDEILLARHKHRNQDIYTCIAGFIEIGETVNQCVKREVREETGIEIKNIRYCESQGWPFPDQLMIGFRAEYAGGEIHIQKDELLEAKWFAKNNLPAIPLRGSIAYRLITGEFD